MILMKLSCQHGIRSTDSAGSPQYDDVRSLLSLPVRLFLRLEAWSGRMVVGESVELAVKTLFLRSRSWLSSTRAEA